MANGFALVSGPFRRMDRYVWTILAVLLVAVGVRVHGLAWDEGHLFHPDERFVLGIADALRWPENSSALLTSRSGLNPFWNADAGTSRRFPYGHLPVYLVRLTAPLVAPFVGAALQHDALIGAGRILAVLADTSGVFLAYLLGRKLYDNAAGLLAAASVAVAVLHIQQAHFYTADILLAPVTLGLLLVLVGLVSEPGPEPFARHALAAGVLFGLALGIKVTALLLLVPITVAYVLPAFQDRARPVTWRDAWRRITASSSWAWFGPTVLVGGAAFALTNPYVPLDGRTFVRSLAAEAGMVRGRWIVAYTEQYRGTWPYVYPFVQHVRWFLGPTLALLAWGGVVTSIWYAVRGRLSRGEFVALAWLVPFVVLVGGLFAKFPRYWLPAVPVMVVLGSGRLTQVIRSSRDRAVVMIVVLAPALLYAVAFSRMYAERHPWLQASEWMYRHVPAGTTLLVERWDHALPVPMAVDGELRSPDEFDQVEVDSFASSPELAGALATADAVVLSSRRVWKVVVTQPSRHQGAAETYRSLLDGRTTYRLKRLWRVEPVLGPVSFRANPFTEAGLSVPSAWEAAAPAPMTLDLGPADESFSVYDHPLVIVLSRR